jgi:hypothetical protein
MSRYNISESSSEEVAKAPTVIVEEEDGSDIDGGNVDNFPAVLLPRASRRSQRAAIAMVGTLITSLPFH